jgi:hypothetical protein
MLDVAEGVAVFLAKVGLDAAQGEIHRGETARGGAGGAGLGLGGCFAGHGGILPMRAVLNPEDKGGTRWARDFETAAPETWRLGDGETGRRGDGEIWATQRRSGAT